MESSDRRGWFISVCLNLFLESCFVLEELLPGGHGLLVRGYLPVINTLAKGLDISLNHRVTKIVRNYEGVKVTVEDGRSFVADAAIVAVPIGVLKTGHIMFEPRLPEWKEKAIDDLEVGHENKIALHFDKMAQYIEKMSDEAAANYAFMQLKKILPEASNPHETGSFKRSSCP